VRVKSPWIYTKRKELIYDADYNICATDEVGAPGSVKLCQQPRWSSDLYGDLLAGWIATAIVCGGMDWRPHLWVTGNHGTGRVNDH